MPFGVCADVTDLEGNHLPGDAAILEGGIREWVKQYGKDEQLVTTIPDLN